MFWKSLKKQTDSEHISWTSAHHSIMCFFPADITVIQVSGVHLVITNQVISGKKQNLTKHVTNSRKQPLVFKNTIFFF